jgi:hypothetical protein
MCQCWGERWHANCDFRPTMPTMYQRWINVLLLAGWLPFWKRWNFGRFYVYAPTNTYRCVDLEEQLFCIFIAVIKLDIDTFIFILQHIFISEENFTMKHQTEIYTSVGVCGRIHVKSTEIPALPKR